MFKLFKNIPLFLIILLGIAGQLLIICPSGNRIKGDIFFWSAHGHDAMWHIAVAQEIQKGLPLQNPVFAGEKLVNYHIFSDVPLAIINRLFNIPYLTIYFWIMPIIYSLFLGATAYFVGKEIGRSKLTGLISVFSVYFIGSFGFLVNLIRGESIGGESLFWATQVQSSIGNPPQILSDILFLYFVYLLSKYLNNKLRSKTSLILALLGTAMAKIYAGMVILPALGILALYRYYKSKNFDLLFVTIISSVLIFLIYLPFTQGAGSYLIFEPLWYVRRLFSDPGRIGVNNFDLIVQHYQSLHTLKSKLGLARYDILGLLLLLFGNLGIRSLGFITIPKQLKQNMELSIFLLTTLTISYLIPNLFLQKGVATNTSQTLQFMLLVMGIYFAIWLSDFLQGIKKLQYKILLFIIILGLSLPTQIGLLYSFYSRNAYAKISSNEIEGLNYLKYNLDENDIILTPPYDRYLDTKEVPPPIWDWFDTSYVAAMTESRTYFSDYEQVDIMGYDYKDRENLQNTIFHSNNQNIISQTIKDIGVDYIYSPVRVINPLFFDNPSLKIIFRNSETVVFKVE